jgi:hypothetical protein
MFLIVPPRLADTVLTGPAARTPDREPDGVPRP